jgi:cytochrome P450
MGVPNPPFLERFNHVMSAIANPVYLLLPFMEKMVPRPQIHKEIAVIHSAFDDLINRRRTNKGSDLISLLLEDETLSHDEVRENAITFFIASHVRTSILITVSALTMAQDSSSGSISSLMYYLAASPEYQDRARAEVLSVLGPIRDPTLADLNDMPFVHACVREVLRINTPVTSSVPRTCKSPVRLGQYAIPANTGVMPNSYVWHHAASEWPDAYVFSPERWFDEKGNVKSSADGWRAYTSVTSFLSASPVFRSRVLSWSSPVPGKELCTPRAKDFHCDVPSGV